MAKKDALKLSEANTIRLLQLYKGEPCLYDISTENYRNRYLRIAALKRIAAALSVDGFGPKEIAAKFKNLRNSYSQELKKIKESDASGGGTYSPKVYWFSVMDSFIRPYLYTRQGQSNAVLTHKSLTKKTLSHRRHEDDDYEDEDIGVMLEDQTVVSPAANTEEDETKFFIKRESTQSLQEDTEDSFFGGTSQGIVKEERYADLRVSQVSGIKRKRESPPEKATTSNEQSDTSTALDRPYEISRLALSMDSKKRDMYSHFGDYIASVLRQTGGQKAVLMQRDICNVIFTHLSGSTSVHTYVPSDNT